MTKFSTYDKIRGVTHRNGDGSERQEILSRCSEGEKLFLHRDYDNPEDNNAVVVRRMNGEKLGYLSRSVAEDVAPKLDSGERLKAKIENLTGGGSKNRGCNLRIYTPREWSSDKKSEVNSEEKSIGCLDGCAGVASIIGLILLILAIFVPAVIPVYGLVGFLLLISGVLWKEAENDVD